MAVRPLTKNPDAVWRLIAKLARNLASFDSPVRRVSADVPETDVACLVALRAEGYRGKLLRARFGSQDGVLMAWPPASEVEHEKAVARIAG